MDTGSRKVNPKLQKEFTDKELFDLFQFRINGLQEGDTEEGFIKHRKECLFGILPDDYDKITLDVDDKKVQLFRSLKLK